jgi:outer membrane protein
MRKTGIVLFAGMLVTAMLALAPSNVEAKVGFINLQRLVNESKMGQSARSEFQKMRQEKERVVAAKLQEVNELRDLINQAGDQMSPQDKRNKLLALQKANKEYQRLVSDVKEDILREDRQLVSIILQKADGVLKKVAQRLNYTIILKDANVIGYLDPSVDITDEVIKELNKK